MTITTTNAKKTNVHKFTCSSSNSKSNKKALKQTRNKLKFNIDFNVNNSSFYEYKTSNLDKRKIKDGLNSRFDTYELNNFLKFSNLILSYIQKETEYNDLRLRLSNTNCVHIKAEELQKLVQYNKENERKLINLDKELNNITNKTINTMGLHINDNENAVDIVKTVLNGVRSFTNELFYIFGNRKDAINLIKNINKANYISSINYNINKDEVEFIDSIKVIEFLRNLIIHTEKNDYKMSPHDNDNINKLQSLFKVSNFKENYYDVLTDTKMNGEKRKEAFINIATMFNNIINLVEYRFSRKINSKPVLNRNEFHFGNKKYRKIISQNKDEKNEKLNAYFLSRHLLLKPNQIRIKEGLANGFTTPSNSGITLQ